MSVVRLILRIQVSTVLAVVLGLMGAIGFTVVLEPIYQQIGGPLGGAIMDFAAAGVIGIMIVLIVWTIVAPIREDTRQEVRRRP